MLTDYELFLSGCYSAVVELNYENDDLYNFIDLMKKLGLGNYAEYLEKIDERIGIIFSAKKDGIKHLCMEYQMGKGFTYDDKENYIKNCGEEIKILTLNDLKKATGYDEDYKQIFFKEIGGSKLDILDDFCDMYGWLPVSSQKYGFNILDTQLSDKVVEEECYKTFSELVNRVVGRAIDYFRDEMEIDENDEEQKEYGLSLLQIAKEYKSGDKWEESWLESFEEELK